MTNDEMGAAVNELAEISWHRAIDARQNGDYRQALQWLHIAGHLEDAEDALVLLSSVTD